MRKTFGRLSAVALSVSLLAVAVPAEAGFRGFRSGPAVGFGFGHSSVGGALGAGLVGGLALGLLAHAQRQPTGLAFAPAPEAYFGPEEEVIEEVWRTPRTVRPAPTRRDLRRAPSRADSPAARTARPSAVINACSSAIVKAAKAYGDTRVSAASAGPVLRDQQGRSVNVNARIEYRRGTRTEVRSARVNCRLDPNGHVVAIR